jgi:hypothetical protein
MLDQAKCPRGRQLQGLCSTLVLWPSSLSLYHKGETELTTMWQWMSMIVFTCDPFYPETPKLTRRKVLELARKNMSEG